MHEFTFCCCSSCSIWMRKAEWDRVQWISEVSLNHLLSVFLLNELTASQDVPINLHNLFFVFVMHNDILPCTFE